MIKVSKMADYAVVILSAMARADGALMTSTAIAQASNLPEPTVAKILKLAAGAQILESIRGANGGYRLVKTPSEITVADIVAAVDGPIALTACVDGGEGSCDYQAQCAVRGRWDGVNRAMKQALASVTLADMALPQIPNRATMHAAAEASA